MRLKSSNSDAVVEFSDVRGDSFRIAVQARDHSAVRDVSAYTDALGVVRLFSEAARDWRGWQGAKAWESLEGELRLELTTDRSGHVALRVRIRSVAGGSDPWCIDTEIGLEAGGLEGLRRCKTALGQRG